MNFNCRNSGSLEISNKDDEAMEKNLLEAEMQPKKERETYKSQDDLFRKIPYIDEDVFVDDTSELESCVDDLTNDVIDMNQY